MSNILHDIKLPGATACAQLGAIFRSCRFRLVSGNSLVFACGSPYAISKTAAGGEIDALDPGGFGALTITKAITLDGGGQVASVLVNGTPGIVVAAGVNDVVTIRNVRINGVNGDPNVTAGTNGIKFLSGKELHIEHCNIFGFSNARIDIEPTAGGKIFIDDTISADNSFAGLFVAAGAATSVDVYKSRFYANGIHGVWAKDNSNVSVTDSDSSGNRQEGFLAFAVSGTATINLTNSSGNNNPTAGVQAGGGGSVNGLVNVTGVSLNNNGTGFSVGANGTIKSFGNNYNTGTGAPSPGLLPVQ